MEEAHELGKDLYISFIDYQKAFVCVDHEKLWSVLNNMGVPRHLISLLQSFYEDQSGTNKNRI